jgi:hypothetical protein
MDSAILVEPNAYLLGFSLLRSAAAFAAAGKCSQERALTSAQWRFGNDK